MRQQVVSLSTHTAVGPVRRCLRAGLVVAGLLMAGAVVAQEAPVPPPQIPNVERIANPYGIEALWQQGDWVARGTLLVLLVMSAGSWYIGIVKLIEQAQLLRDARRTRAFWQAPTVAEGVLALREESPFRYIAEEGLHAVAHHEGTLVEQIELVTWIGLSVQHAHDIVNSRLQGGLAFLATVGSTAPFVGLFGTVWAIYHALTAIGIAGQASIDKVAGPVGEALIMTAFGLAVAVPAVLGYNWLVRRNKVAMEQVRHFSNEVHMALLGKPDRRAAKAG
jgi:biopolymer transport protein ExbB